MPSVPKPWICALVAFFASLAQARAQTSGTAPLYDPAQLPVFHGTVQLFTMTPMGDVDGFILTDGTEVKTPPHLTAALVAAVKPGDRVTVHGLKAASLPLLQAMSVGNDATGTTVVDAGPDAARAMPPAPSARDVTEDGTTRGRVRMLLHGPRGDVNGALLDDGTNLKLPPSEAARFAELLATGTVVKAEGRRRVTPIGTVVDLTALGRDGGVLQPIFNGSRSGHRGSGQPPS